MHSTISAAGTRSIAIALTRTSQPSRSGASPNACWKRRVRPLQRRRTRRPSRHHAAIVRGTLHAFMSLIATRRALRRDGFRADVPTLCAAAHRRANAVARRRLAGVRTSGEFLRRAARAQGLPPALAVALSVLARRRRPRRARDRRAPVSVRRTRVGRMRRLPGALTNALKTSPPSRGFTPRNPDRRDDHA